MTRPERSFVIRVAGRIRRRPSEQNGLELTPAQVGGAAVLRPYIGQVLEFAQSYGHRPCGSADGWWQAADDAHH